jgi:hypothetical protein
MDKDESGDASTRETAGRRGGPGAEAVLFVVCGVATSIGGIYSGTHSVAATVMAGCAGVAAAALVAWRKH